MAKQILINAVRVRGNQVPKVQGGLDGKLLIYKEGKDIILLLVSTSNEYPILDRTQFIGGATDDINTLISRYLSSEEPQRNYKVIQDPFDPSIIPFQNVLHHPLQ